MQEKPLCTSESLIYAHAYTLTTEVDDVNMPALGAGGGGGAGGLFLKLVECELFSGTNGRAKSRSRSCI